MKKLSLTNLFSVGFLFIFSFMILTGLNSVSLSTTKKEKEALETALKHDIVECYAMEGRYPESLDYIKENYGLTYDESKFYVDYQPLGENIMPEVTIVDLE